MGSNLSSVEAIITCCFAEIKYNESLILGATIYSSHDEASLHYALKRKLDFQQNCYHSSLTLEEEDIENQTCRYLEAKLLFSDTDIKARHFSKNIEHLRSVGQQRFFNLQNASSFSNRRTKRGVLIARAVSITTVCTSKALLRESLIDFFIECRHLGYSVRNLKRTCRSMFLRTNDPFWLRMMKNEAFSTEVPRQIT